MKIKAIYPIWVGDRLYQAGEYPIGLKGKALQEAKDAGHVVEVKTKKVKHGNRKNS